MSTKWLPLFRYIGSAQYKRLGTQWLSSHRKRRVSLLVKLLLSMAGRLCPSHSPPWMSDIVADDLVCTSRLRRLDNFLPIDKQHQMLNSRPLCELSVKRDHPAAAFKVALCLDSANPAYRDKRVRCCLQVSR